MNSPKVIHVITRLIVGGAQENTILSCHGLLDRGYDITLVTGPESGPEGSLLDDARGKGVPVVVLESLRRNPRPLLDLKTLFALKKLFLREQPAIVHTHSSKAGILGRLAAKKAGVPVIVHTNHGLPFHAGQNWFVNRLWRRLEKWVAPATAKFVCVGETMKRQSIEAGLAPPERHEVVYSGMDVSRFGPLAPPSADSPVIGWVGRLVAQKGPRDLPEVLDPVMQKVPAARVRIVGDGPLRSEIEASLGRRPWAERVSFTGRVAPETVSSHLASMDVAVMTSYWEGLPRVAVQAAMAGLPVVAYDVEGASEVVRSGETGFLVPTGDTGALAERLIHVLSRPDRGRSLGEKGRALVGDRFDGRRMIEALDRIYKSLL